MLTEKKVFYFKFQPLEFERRLKRGNCAIFDNFSEDEFAIGYQKYARC